MGRGDASVKFIETSSEIISTNQESLPSSLSFLFYLLLFPLGLKPVNSSKHSEIWLFDLKGWLQASICVFKDQVSSLALCSRAVWVHCKGSGYFKAIQSLMRHGESFLMKRLNLPSWQKDSYWVISTPSLLSSTGEILLCQQPHFQYSLRTSVLIGPPFLGLGLWSLLYSDSSNSDYTLPGITVAIWAAVTRRWQCLRLSYTGMG